MPPVTCSHQPATTLKLLVLCVLIEAPRRAVDLVKVVRLAGAGWTPTPELIVDAVTGLMREGFVDDTGEVLCASDDAVAELGRLAASYRPEGLGDADVNACACALALLPVEARDSVVDVLTRHWQTRREWWRCAARQCPCGLAPVQSLFRRRLAEAEAELIDLAAFSAVPERTRSDKPGCQAAASR